MARNPLTPIRSGAGFLGADPFLSLHREVNRLFDDVLHGPAQGAQSSAGSFIPAHLNVSETANEIRITAELPGVNQDDIEFNLDNNILTIRGEKRFERTDEKENFHFVERSYGTFQRSVQLPYRVDPGQVQARFDNGVLTVVVPKSRMQDPSRRIQIQGGSGASQGAGSGEDQPSNSPEPSEQNKG